MSMHYCVQASHPLILVYNLPILSSLDRLIPLLEFLQILGGLDRSCSLGVSFLVDSRLRFFVSFFCFAHLSSSMSLLTFSSS